MNNKKIIMGKGKDFSKVAREAEQNFNNWLQASNLSEKDLLKLIEQEAFYLTFWADGSVAITILHGCNCEIGMPFVWQKENNISFEAYKTDVGLLLMLIESKCNSEVSKKKIKDFVKENLVKK